MRQIKQPHQNLANLLACSCYFGFRLGTMKVLDRLTNARSACCKDMIWGMSIFCVKNDPIAVNLSGIRLDPSLLHLSFVLTIALRYWQEDGLKKISYEGPFISKGPTDFARFRQVVRQSTDNLQRFATQYTTLPLYHFPLPLLPYGLIHLLPTTLQALAAGRVGVSAWIKSRQVDAAFSVHDELRHAETRYGPPQNTCAQRRTAPLSQNCYQVPLLSRFLCNESVIRNRSPEQRNKCTKQQMLWIANLEAIKSQYTPAFFVLENGTLPG